MITRTHRASGVGVSRPHRLAATLPVNREAERAVLGAILLRDDLLPEVIAAGLRVDHFGLGAHRELFSAMQAVRGRGSPVDLITVMEELGGRLESIGGAAWMADLTTGVILRRESVLHYVSIIQRYACRRSLARIGEWTLAAACEPGCEPAWLATEAMQQIQKVKDEICPPVAVGREERSGPGKDRRASGTE
ncbi:MAG: hypothetical protein L0387_46180 [Acidobacteria bacterium]|nr:hypothetical protein [Acidobacteriota bacterium]